MHIVVVGLNHKTAPIELRERLAFSPDTIEEPLRKVTDLSQVNEALILSTCNRVEVLAVVREIGQGIEEIKNFLSSHHGIPSGQLDSSLYSHDSHEAIKHIFQVAASLDSMVVGEPQILGQLKEAYTLANQYKTSGLILHRFLHRAFVVGKKVRTETRIASTAVSISYAAIELAKKIFDTLENKVVMLIGAGEMSELAARHLLNHGVRDILVTNRTHARAERLAEEFGGKPIVFEDFTLFLDQVDIVISSTGSPDYSIRYDDVTRALKIRKYRPVFFIDIAVPRDIEPRINNISNAYLYDIDDLQGVVDANIKERKEEAKKAEKIIDREMEQFEKWLESLSVVPTIVSLRGKFEEIRKKEVEKTLSSLNGGMKVDKKVLDALTSSIINKILHSPVTQLKKQENTHEVNYHIKAIRDLFNLEG